MTPADTPPMLRVVRGDATPEEIAALLVMLTAARRTTPRSPSEPASTWATRASTLGQPLPHGPNTWRASGLPH